MIKPELFFHDKQINICNISTHFFNQTVCKNIENNIMLILYNFLSNSVQYTCDKCVNVLLFMDSNDDFLSIEVMNKFDSTSIVGKKNSYNIGLKNCKTLAISIKCGLIVYNTDDTFHQILTIPIVKL